MHIYKIFYIKTFKIVPTCFDPKIIFRELHCSLLKSDTFVLQFDIQKYSRQNIDVSLTVHLSN